MEIYRELNSNKGIALALGFFDGMHLGHKKIIQTLVQKAKMLKIKTGVITFDTNPADFFNPAPTPNIQTFKDRQLMLEHLGVDYLYELDFEKLKDLTAQQYLETIVKYFAPKFIVVGYNHTFGKNKEGNSEFLSAGGTKYGYEAVVLPEYKYSGTEKVSSSEIRKRIQHGHLNAVKALLGRNFSVRNSVIKGNGIARTLGYPTANLVWPESMAKLPYGVYWGFCQCESKVIPALISWGIRPTLTPGENEVLEVHIYNFNESLYGKIIKVSFSKKIRDEERFSGLKALTEQLHKDYEEFEQWAKQNTFK